MEGGQGQKWGCSAKEKKWLSRESLRIITEHYITTTHPAQKYPYILNITSIEGSARCLVLALLVTIRRPDYSSLSMYSRLLPLSKYFPAVTLHRRWSYAQKISWLKVKFIGLMRGYYHFKFPFIQFIYGNCGTCEGFPTRSLCQKIWGTGSSYGGWQSLLQDTRLKG
jgi:hypothetical protein